MLRSVWLHRGAELRLTRGKARRFRGGRPMRSSNGYPLTHDKQARSSSFRSQEGAETRSRIGLCSWLAWVSDIVVASKQSNSSTASLGLRTLRTRTLCATLMLCSIQTSTIELHSQGHSAMQILSCAIECLPSKKSTTSKIEACDYVEPHST